MKLGSRIYHVHAKDMEIDSDGARDAVAPYIAESACDANVG
jgi:sugar phosphate isomerase/epimerase